MITYKVLNEIKDDIEFDYNLQQKAITLFLEIFMFLPVAIILDILTFIPQLIIGVIYLILKFTRGCE